MTAIAPPPPPAPEPSSSRDKADRRKKVALAINGLLIVGIVAVVILRPGPTAQDVSAGSTTTNPPARAVEDDSSAFVSGVVGVTASTTTTTSTTVGPTATTTAPTTTAPTTTAATAPDEAPVLTGELDENGIPVGLEFPLFNDQHTIIGGENLWLIAANQLAAITDRTLEQVPQTDIAAYWERVIDNNRTNLRSGNPDLVYPGEVITFPGAD